MSKGERFIKQRAAKSWRPRRGKIGGNCSKVRQLKDMSEDEKRALEEKYGCKISGDKRCQDIAR